MRAREAEHLWKWRSRTIGLLACAALVACNGAGTTAEDGTSEDEGSQSDAAGPSRPEHMGATNEPSTAHESHESHVPAEHGPRTHPVASEYRECTADADCTLVSVACDSCCDREAVATSKQAAYEQERERACASFRGGECDCSRRPLAARCLEGSCAEVPAAYCVVDGRRHLPGQDGIRDPFSCNECTCSDGQLSCDEASCPKPCPAGNAPGVSCLRCGPGDGCEALETGCYPTCTTDGDCSEADSKRCLNGLCRTLCG